MGNLSFVTLDTWTLIFTWVNLLILFLLVKKFFTKPMQKMLQAREAEINAQYSKADQATEKAETLKKEYEEKISKAQDEANTIISDAVGNASLRSDAIVKEAEEKAQGMSERAQKSIDAQKEAAFSELKGDVSSMAVGIANKIIEKDINEKDHEALIDKALESLGE